MRILLLILKLKIELKNFENPPSLTKRETNPFNYKLNFFVVYKKLSGEVNSSKQVCFMHEFVYQLNLNIKFEFTW